jgi:biopolymer transport protein ExbD
MKIPLRTQDRGFAFNITPLIDVVFLLIIFFLVASHFIRNEQVERVDLPSATQGKEDVEIASRLVITVTADGVVYLGPTAITLEEFEQRLQMMVAQHGLDVTELRIRADRSVEYSRVEPLLLTAARLGVTHVRFAVIKN